MKIDDKIMVTFPNKKGKENVILNYDGAKTFEYKLKDDEKEKECYVVDYDDKYYIFYDEDEKRIETEEKNMKLRVLKNANIGQGSSFMFIANEEDTYKKNLSDEKYYYDIETVMRNRDDNIFSNSLQFYASYVIFDNKGYITDLYDFTVE
jgi:predicted glutamine amidotransferase